LVLLIMIMVMATTSPSFQGGTTAIYLHCIFFPDKLANQFFMVDWFENYITVHGKGDDGRQQRSPALGQPLSCTLWYYKTTGDCSFKQWRNECPSDINTTKGSCYKLTTGLNLWLCCCVPMINT
jgi:hypothetical protein